MSKIDVKMYPYNVMVKVAGEVTINEEYVEIFKVVMDKLSQREKEVIGLRFERGLTTKECGVALGITVGRIRKIEEEFIEKLKWYMRFKDRCNVGVSLAEIEISHRVFMALVGRNGIGTIDELLEMSAADVGELRNIGKDAANEVKRALDKRGLSLRKVR